MYLSTQQDINQQDSSDRNSLALCPVCGQKLFEVESLSTKGVFRLKCRRCKKYIRVYAIDTENNTQ